MDDSNTPVERDAQEWKKWRRWLLWLVALGVLLAWVLTWSLDAPLRPSLAERGDITTAWVNVSGYACGQFSEGSGFLVEPDLALTNAHVVAGIEEITVSRVGGGSVIGTLVGFHPGRDVAAVRLAGWESSPGMASLGPVLLASVGAIAGDEGDVATVDPEDGLEFVPFKVVRRLLDTGRDIYAEESGGRSVLEIRSLVSRGDSGAALLNDDGGSETPSNLGPGDSGAALLNHDGQVVGMVIGTAGGKPDVGYALEIGEIRAFLAELDDAPVPHPPCRTR